MTTRTPLLISSTALWLYPTLAVAHGGHEDVGVLHGLWHALPLLAVGLVALIFILRIRRSSPD